MSKIIPFLFLFACLLSGLFFLDVGQVRAEEISPPIISEVRIDTSRNIFGNILLTGLTPANTEVLVYVNEELVGMASVKSEGTETDNFYFRTEDALSIDEHEVMVLARDKASSILSEPNLVVVAIPNLPAPTLVEPSEGQTVGMNVYSVAGLTVNNTFVHIYIDGVYHAKTEILKHESGTADFAYKLPEDLLEGAHQAWVVAEDELGRTSNASRELKFQVEYPMPAPIILAPVADSVTRNNEIFIVGLAKNGSLIKIYIDEQLDGQFLVENQSSGTANFAYTPSVPLTNGNHLVYATALDIEGKESRWSNIVYFDIAAPTASSLDLGDQDIVSVDAEEDTSNSSQSEQLLDDEGDLEEADIISSEVDEETSPEIKVSQIDDEDAIIKPTTAEANETVQVQDKALEPEIVEIKDQDNNIISVTESDQEEDSAINNILEDAYAPEEQAETGEEDKTFSYQFLIFVAFLAGIIAWIIWVNKELIKERKEQKSQDSSTNEKSSQLKQSSMEERTIPESAEKK